MATGFAGDGGGGFSGIWARLAASLIEVVIIHRLPVEAQGEGGREKRKLMNGFAHQFLHFVRGKFGGSQLIRGSDFLGKQVIGGKITGSIHVLCFRKRSGHRTNQRVAAGPNGFHG